MGVLTTWMSKLHFCYIRQKGTRNFKFKDEYEVYCATAGFYTWNTWEDPNDVEAVNGIKVIWQTTGCSGFLENFQKKFYSE